MDAYQGGKGIISTIYVYKNQSFCQHRHFCYFKKSAVFLEVQVGTHVQKMAQAIEQNTVKKELINIFKEFHLSFTKNHAMKKIFNPFIIHQNLLKQ